MNDFIQLILEIIFFIFIIISEIPILLKLKETRNKLYYIVILFLTVVEVYAIFQIFTYFQLFNELIGEGLTYNIILWILGIAIISEFSFYIKELKYFYTLPFIVGIFVSVGLIINNNLISLIFYTLIFGGLSALLLIWEGYKNKNLGHKPIQEFKVAREFAQIMFLIIQLANHYKIDLESSILNELEIMVKRFDAKKWKKYLSTLGLD